jgi:hypothetical protein
VDEKLKRDLDCYDTVFIVGNGQSRKGFDLHRLFDYGIVYGCNALYRDFQPDVLVVMDGDMLIEVRESKYDGHVIHQHLDRNRQECMLDWEGREYEKRNLHPSGVTAMHVAIQRHIQVTKVVLLGFDVGLQEHGKPNNVYAWTRNYSNPRNMEHLARRWAAYMAVIFMEYPKHQFVRVGSRQDHIPEWTGCENLFYMDYGEFEQWLKQTQIESC